MALIARQKGCQGMDLASCLGEAEAALGVADPQPFPGSASSRQRGGDEHPRCLRSESEKGEACGVMLVFIINLTGYRCDYASVSRKVLDMDDTIPLVLFSTKYKQESILSISICYPLLLVSG